MTENDKGERARPYRISGVEDTRQLEGVQGGDGHRCNGDKSLHNRGVSTVAHVAIQPLWHRQPSHTRRITYSYLVYSVASIDGLV